MTDVAPERAVLRGTADELGSVAEVRRWASGVVRSWGLGDREQDVVLVVSELITNACLHAPGGWRLVLTRRPGSVRIDVHDGAELLQLLVGPPSSASGGQRGLVVIDALSSAWGVECRGAGKVVWCELDDSRGSLAG